MKNNSLIVHATIAMKVINDLFSLFLVSLFKFLVRHPVRFDDRALASVVEPQCKKKIGAVAIIHFARCIFARGDRLSSFTGWRNRDTNTLISTNCIRLELVVGSLGVEFVTEAEGSATWKVKPRRVAASERVKEASFKSVSGVSAVHSSTLVFVFPTFFTDALCCASKEIVKRSTPV